MGVYLIGIVLELLSTFAGTVGKQLIRYGALVERRKNDRRKNFKAGRRIGCLGLSLTTTVGVCDSHCNRPLFFEKIEGIISSCEDPCYRITGLQENCPGLG